MAEWRIDMPDDEAEPGPGRALPAAGAAGASRSAVAFLRETATRARLTLRAGLRGLIGIVYPPTCIACQAATGEAQALCPACWRGIGFIERPYCERLGTPFPVDLGAGLLSQGAKLLVIEDNPDAVETAKRDGAELLVGNAADPEVLSAAAIGRAVRLFVAIPGSFEAGQVCEQARAENPALPIVARAHSDAEVAHLTKCGATLTIMGEAEIARAMLSLCQNLKDADTPPPAEAETASEAAKPEAMAELPAPKPPVAKPTEDPPADPPAAA